MADGTLKTPQEAEQRFRTEHQRRWGAMGFDSARLLEQKLPIPNPQALLIVGDNVRDREEIVNAAQNLNLQIFSFPEKPFMVVEGLPASIAQLARVSQVKRIDFAPQYAFEAGGVISSCDPPILGTAAGYTKSLFRQNANGNYAQGVKVGLSELRATVVG